MRNFNELPQEVQEKAKNTLKAYDEVNVIYEYGEYHVSVGVALKAQYAPDHEVIGRYRAEDIFTDNERIINYVESFHDYPIQYKGKRNYRLFDGIGWETRFEFDNDGNIVKA